ncbi:MAG: F0F1 ATP synthase subunit epsilon [Calditrichaeota bacterium]|nr:MAG: F0F1 ATP synthase subunit epsilon [Calditrichota bacterium]MBL1206704.1 F0F1 ATP synthase subunit epsilon [Calditrichota bacterium]NOG46530.1 F0F1 ATP synthase subunit epsilon [Calditrichota bacterium]
MSENLHLEIVTPFGKTFSEEVLSCVVPGVRGQFQILTNHAPVISNITVGAIKIRTNSKESVYIATSGGFCEVRNNEIKVIVESAEKSDEIDVSRALKSKERAEERLKTKSENIDDIRAKLALSRAINRIHVTDYTS